MTTMSYTDRFGHKSSLPYGGWDSEGADGTGFECRDCHAEYDVLPEGWDVDYV